VSSSDVWIFFASDPLVPEIRDFRFGDGLGRPPSNWKYRDGSRHSWDHLFLEAISYHGRRTGTRLVQLATFNGLRAELVDRWPRSAEEQELVERIDDFWRVCR
jgi:hypothetical protein